MWRARDTIDLISERVPQECVAATVMANVRGLAARLPSIFSSYYLECRLAADQNQVDFLASVPASPDQERMRRIHAALERSPSRLRREPHWQAALDLIRCWSDPAQGWHLRMPALWIELDHLETRRSARRAPSVCVCVDPRYPDGRLVSETTDPRGAHNALLALLKHALPTRFDEWLPPSRKRAMATCFRRLPPGGRIIHVSLMLGREPVTLKLYGTIPKDRLAAYLNDIGWRGPLDSLRKVVRDFALPDTAEGAIFFDLAMTDALLPYAAIASSQLQLERRSCLDPKLSALVASLERHGLCSPDKRRALEAWPGTARETHPAVASQARIHRWLDTKIVVDGGIAAKAYFGFAPSLSVF